MKIDIQILKLYIDSAKKSGWPIIVGKKVADFIRENFPDEKIKYYSGIYSKNEDCFIFEYKDEIIAKTKSVVG